MLSHELHVTRVSSTGDPGRTKCRYYRSREWHIQKLMPFLWIRCHSKAKKSGTKFLQRAISKMHKSVSSRLGKISNRLEK
nr:MAG TPA: hypothetical protein [Caudoviricetes sp.]